MTLIYQHLWPPNMIRLKKILLQIQLINNQIHSILTDKSMTCMDLKHCIYQNFSKELNPKSMNLSHKEEKINNNMKLQKIKFASGSKARVKQSKLDLIDVEGLIVDAKGVDPLADQVGTVKMSCGHSIGRDSMVELIRHLISTSKCEIRCPHVNHNGQACLKLGFLVCKKVGVLTLSQMQQFQFGMSLNWVNKDARNNPDFDRNAVNNLLRSSPTKVFHLIVKGGEKEPYNVPQYRACVHCFSIVKHETGCKHMICTSCSNSFCWLCLSVPQNGNYKCGGGYDHCGVIAQNRTI